ncbi:MAG: hypothetical protein ACFFAN_05420 [Promethearchaeota archaeon]
MKKLNIDKYKELVELMPSIQKALMKGLQRDFQYYDVIRIKRIFKFLQIYPVVFEFFITLIHIR